MVFALIIIVIFSLFMLIRYVFKRYKIVDWIMRKLCAIRDRLIRAFRITAYVVVGFVLVGVALQVFLPDELKKQLEESRANQKANEKSTQQEIEAEKPLSVPSDSNAQFFVLEKGGSGALRTIVTKRVGSIGTSYSKRLYNCTDSTVKYLGTGDSLAAMAASWADPNMGPIVQDSIAYYVGVEACK